MSFLLSLLLVIQILSAVIMIGLVLLQQGKGADMGAAFGSGSSGSLFGATGGANFMSRTTAVFAGVFFLTTLVLSYFGNVKSAGTSSVLDKPAASSSGTPSAAPAAPAPAALAPNQIPDNKGISPPPAPAAAPTPSANGTAAPSPAGAAPSQGGAANIPTNQIPGK